MTTLRLKVYDIFKNRFNEKEAELVIEYFENKAEEKYAIKKDLFLTKQDKVELVEKIESSKTDIIKWMVAMWIAQMAAIVFIIIRK